MRNYIDTQISKQKDVLYKLELRRVRICALEWQAINEYCHSRLCYASTCEDDGHKYRGYEIVQGFIDYCKARELSNLDKLEKLDAMIAEVTGK